MSKYTITNNNISKLNNVNSEVLTLNYKRDLNSYNTGTVIDALLNYKYILPKLENIYIYVEGTTEWSHDMKMFECLYFLMVDEQIKNVIISNGKYNIKKENNKFILEMPYSYNMSIPHDVNEVTLFYEYYSTSNRIIFSSDLPITLIKMNIRVRITTIHAGLEIFDINQKIPFGTEINLIIIGNSKIIKLTTGLTEQQIKIFHGPGIIIGDELKKNNFDFFDIQAFK